MRKIFYSLTIFLTIFVFNSLNAKDVVLGVGGRAGATLDPDQVHLGIHLDLGELAERVRVQPSVEIGFGSDITLVAVNPEVVYLFNKRDKWTPYAGGGLGLNIVNRDRPSPGQDNTKLEVGLNLLAGIEAMVSSSTRLFFEGKFGVGDSPDFKATCGFTIMR